MNFFIQDSTSNIPEQSGAASPETSDMKVDVGPPLEIQVRYAVIRVQSCCHGDMRSVVCVTELDFKPTLFHYSTQGTIHVITYRKVIQWKLNK